MPNNSLALRLLEAVARAVSHAGERRTVLPEAEIRAVALGHAPGRYTLGEVDAAIERLVRGGELIEVERRGMDRAFVTDRAVKAERRVLAAMRAGRGKGMALANGETVEKRLDGMRGILWTLMHTARLHRLAVADGISSSRGWLAAIDKASEKFYLPPEVPASEFLFTDPKSWNSGEVGRRLDAAGQDWPEFEDPFALLCWPALDVSKYEVNGRNRELGHVKVRTPVVRPSIGGDPVRKPYLFLGVVERSGDGRRWECTKACAQPIVAADCPIPVDSHYERRALGSLRSLVGNLTESGKLKKALGGAVRVELEKPLTRTEVAGGPCLPDFLITVTRPGAYSHFPKGPGHPEHRGRFNPRDRARYVVEVMGFDDEEYERDKEKTHPRMERIGPVSCMEGRKFDSAGNPLRRQREEITADIEKDILERWTASETT